MLPGPSLVRNPSEYDDTSFSLDNVSDLYRALALNELRETSQIKEQALVQLREWIAKHPAIKSCRTDARFLLKFLRVRKYNHVSACDNLERYLVMRQSTPQWYMKLNIDEPWVSDVIDVGAILPLGYDRNGKLVTLVKIGNFDTKKYTNQHLVRFWTMILDSYQEEAEMQIAGGSAVFDLNGFTMAHIAQWPVSELHKYVNFMTNTTPMRIKGIHMVNIPKYAVSFAELVVSFFSAKQKSRTHFYKSFDEYTKSNDAAVLPKEYDARGQFTLEELKNQLRKRFARYRDLVYEQSMMEIDVTKCKSLQKQDVANGSGFGVDGSFRKLNLD